MKQSPSDRSDNFENDMQQLNQLLNKLFQLCMLIAAVWTFYIFIKAPSLPSFGLFLTPVFFLAVLALLDKSSGKKSAEPEAEKQTGIPAAPSEKSNLQNVGKSENRRTGRSAALLAAEKMAEQEAKEKAGKEYEAFISDAGALPECISDMKLLFSDYIDHVEASYDGSSGSSPYKFYLELQRNYDIRQALHELAAWRTLIIEFDQTHDTDSLPLKSWHELYQYKNLDMIIHCEEDPEFSTDELALCEANHIYAGKAAENHETAIYLYNDHTALVLDFETYAGSADDAATYISWSWKKKEST